MADTFDFDRPSPVNTTGFAWNPEQLLEEFAAAGIVEIPIINIDNLTELNIFFTVDLSAGDETALNNVITAHVPRDFGIVIEGATGAAADLPGGGVALASAELNWFNNENTIFESNTVQDVIEEISSLTWLQTLQEDDPDVLVNSPVIGGGVAGATGEQGGQGPQGNTGVDGDVGGTGNTGAVGATGSDGLLGSTGAAGPAGATGEAAVGGLAGYEYHEDLTEKSTTSNSYVTYTTMTTSSLDAGDYRIGWVYDWKGSNSNRDFLACIEVDDVEISCHREEPSQGSEAESQRHVNSGFRKITLTSGVHTIKLRYARESSPASSTIYEAHLELMRVN